MYDYLSELEKEHQRNERSRLVYVACTRARRRLHLFGSAKPDPKSATPKTPPPTSLLALLWPAVNDRFQAALNSWTEPVETEEPAEAIAPANLHRLDPQWTLPDLSTTFPNSTIRGDATDEAEPIEFDWARESSRIVGIVIHRELQSIDRIGWGDWRNRTFSDQDKNRWRRYLTEGGLAASQLGEGLAHLETALTRIQTDQQAAWIFSEEHIGVRTEWGLTGHHLGVIRHVILDRSFVDGEGIRWILDFKSSRHEDATTLDEFLNQEKERYRSTMMRYAAILSAMEKRPVRTALYYPVLGRLVTYD